MQGLNVVLMYKLLLYKVDPKFDRYHIYRTIEVSDDVYLDCTIPRDPDKGFYLREDGNPIALEVEEKFYIKDTKWGFGMNYPTNEYFDD